jgi:hypothetical protein
LKIARESWQEKIILKINEKAVEELTLYYFKWNKILNYSILFRETQRQQNGKYLKEEWINLKSFNKHIFSRFIDKFSAENVKIIHIIDKSYNI